MTVLLPLTTDDKPQMFEWISADQILTLTFVRQHLYFFQPTSASEFHGLLHYGSWAPAHHNVYRGYETLICVTVIQLTNKLTKKYWSCCYSVFVPGSHLGHMTRFIFSLWRDDGSVIQLYNCIWALPEQSPLGRSSALTDIFYSLIWDSLNPEG
jgi:hypothetical protein